VALGDTAPHPAFWVEQGRFGYMQTCVDGLWTAANAATTRTTRKARTMSCMIQQRGHGALWPVNPPTSRRAHPLLLAQTPSGTASQVVGPMNQDHAGPPTAGSTPKIVFTVPHSARIWNYWLGGKDNYPVDRAAGVAWAGTHPQITADVRSSRKFVVDAVGDLAGFAGVRQGSVREGFSA
jgi:hypothetical protein